MIAAGEVVQRPSSVVKELMENAVDAGADNISVILVDAGRTLIQVVDNGCGMTPDQAVVCFERHATSKLATAEDLGNILTFGFRGEALASIAAVSEVTLRTRTADNEMGCEVEFADSQHLSTMETACPVGSNFSVRNLFYNVPARRKFLKSDNVEFKHVVEEFIRVALTRPDISFSLMHNGKEVYVTHSAGSLKLRIQELFSRSVVNELVEVSTQSSVASISGYIGRPDLAKKTLGNQFFFVNGRYFRSPYLHKALMKGYDNMIPEGTTPSYFLYLQIDPQAIDVNIHPTKTEIKFEDDSLLFQFVFAAIKEVLAKNSFGASIDFDAAQEPDLPVFGKNYESFRPVVEQPEVRFNPDYNPFDVGYVSSPFAGADQYTGGSSSGERKRVEIPNPFGEGGNLFIEETPAEKIDFGPSQKENNPFERRFTDPSQLVDRRQDYGKLFEDKTLPTTSVIILQSRYILSQVQSGVLLVNIRRARERIFYEDFLKAIHKNGHVSQINLFPVEINIGVENRLLIEENAELLRSLGFDFTFSGQDALTVNGVPEAFSPDPDAVEALLNDILIALSEDYSSLPGMMESAMAEKFAEIGSMKASSLTSPIEAQRVIDRLFCCENSEYTIRGLRIMSILGMEEIEKKFK